MRPWELLLRNVNVLHSVLEKAEPELASLELGRAEYICLRGRCQEISSFSPDALGWLKGSQLPYTIGLIGIFIALGHSVLAMSR